MNSFAEVESHLSQLMTASAKVFTKTEIAEVQHFIDVGEYGLALETAVDIYDEEHKEASAEAIQIILDLAEMMGLDPTSFLERLGMR